MMPPAAMLARLDEIDARARAAKGGPWWRGSVTREDRYAGPLCVMAPHDLETDRCVLATLNSYLASEADAAFIAHAREDVPWLAAQLRAALEAHLQETTATIERLRAELAHAKDEKTGTGYWWAEAQVARERAAAAETAQLAAEARLRQALEIVDAAALAWATAEDSEAARLDAQAAIGTVINGFARLRGPNAQDERTGTSAPADGGAEPDRTRRPAADAPTTGRRPVPPGADAIAEYLCHVGACPACWPSRTLCADGARLKALADTDGGKPQADEALIGQWAVCSAGRLGLIQGRAQLPWGLAWVGVGLDGTAWSSRNPRVLAATDATAVATLRRGHPRDATPGSPPPPSRPA